MLISHTPWVPTKADAPNAFAFKMLSTGEILEFPNSWLTHLDRVEEILWDNHVGNYIEIQP